MGLTSLNLTSYESLIGNITPVEVEVSTFSIFSLLLVDKYQIKLIRFDINNILNP